MNKAIGIMGGSFDPVHHGHLRIALDLRKAVGLEHVRLIPTAKPPHKTALQTSAELRALMVAQAIESEPGLLLDDREIRRFEADGKPSYTVNTLENLREEFPEQPLCLILGTDAVAGLHKWHRWTELFDLAHLLIAERPGVTAADYPDVVAEQLEKRRTNQASDLQAALSGKVFTLAVTQLDISATDIRQKFVTGQSARYLLPDTVIRTIQRYRLYQDQPNVEKNDA